ncbi:Alpha/Beta hydrolase protein [Blastocladiella britannica]|nr:Alpha/Beta hydrolase protein [Blastocladiella britannica]
MTPNPNDPASFNHRYTATANGGTIHFVDQGPRAAHVIVFLVHGFPDIWFGWRHVIPALAARGYRVIVPSMRGTGLSSVHHARRDDQDALAAHYSLRAHCRDLAAVAQAVLRDPPLFNTPAATAQGRRPRRLVWVGHDWGSAVVGRMPHYHGVTLVDAVASLCVPYTPPHTDYLTTRVVAKALPHFAYQVAFDEGGESLDAALDRNVDGALTMFFQRPESSQSRAPGAAAGLDLDAIVAMLGPNGAAMRDRAAADPAIALGCVLREPGTDPRVFEYYRECFNRTGFHGGLCAYRVRMINHEDELPFAKRGIEGKRVTLPWLHVTVGKDPCFPPTMGRFQRTLLPNVTVKHIEDSGHWLQQEQPELTIQHLLGWLEDLQRTEFGGGIYKSQRSHL